MEGHGRRLPATTHSLAVPQGGEVWLSVWLGLRRQHGSQKAAGLSLPLWFPEGVGTLIQMSSLDTEGPATPRRR